MAYHPFFNASIGGNSTSAGAGYSNIASGTMVLAGGNNITLSQNAGSITISGANAGGGAAISAAGASASNGTVVFSSSNGVNFGMAGSTVTASHNGLTSQSAQALSGSNGSFAFQTASFSNANGISFGTSAGSAIVASHNGLTSQSAQALSGSNGSIAFQTATLGNLNGLSFYTSNGSIVGSHNGQTQGLQSVVVGGNTSGATASISSGQMTLAGGNNIVLSQAGNVVTIAGGAGGGGFEAGLLDTGAGGTTAGVMGSNTNGLFLYAGSNIGLSQATDTNGASVTVSTPDAVAQSGAFYDNLIQQSNSVAVEYTSLSNAIQNRLLIQPFDPSNDLFPFDMTVSTMYMDFSNSGTSSHSAAHSSTFYIGLYTRVNSTQLSLVNSVSTSVGMAANVGNSGSYIGARYLSFHSSIFSSQPLMSGNKRYYFGFLARSAGTYYQSNSIAGMHYGMSNQRSGFMGTAASSNSTLNAWHPFMGVHNITTFTNMPGSIANSEIVKASAYANFIPRIMLNAGGGQIS